MMAFIWVAVLVAMLVIEGVSVQLTSIWFAAGALAALIVSIFAPQAYAAQIIVFIVVSAAALIAVRPLVRKHMKAKFQPTNADKYIGKEAVVTETVNNIDGKGLVKVGGAIWSARSADDTVIEKDAAVIVDRIEGVKLIVHAV
ncbi:MAG: NfeD family protein [Clostridia bacterium]|nr:NfeD family protein [Clostridia bacterium]